MGVVDHAMGCGSHAKSLSGAEGLILWSISERLPEDHGGLLSQDLLGLGCHGWHCLVKGAGRVALDIPVRDDEKLHSVGASHQVRLDLSRQGVQVEDGGDRHLETEVEVVLTAADDVGDVRSPGQLADASAAERRERVGVRVQEELRREVRRAVQGSQLQR